MPIRYFDIEPACSKLSQKRRLSGYIKLMLEKYLDLKSFDLNIVFCRDEYLLEKNIQFLGHDTLTDIITFDLSEFDNQLIAEIYISVDRVEENALKFEVDYQYELHRVVFHGVLHLCGYKDKTDIEQQEMRLKEEEHLQTYYALT